MALCLAGSAAALAYTVPGWAAVAAGALLLACVAWLAARYLKWVTTSFTVTTERVVTRQGVLSREGREILLNRLTDTSYRQSVWDRLLGCGDVLVESAGRDSPEAFEDLPHPVAIQREIGRLLSQPRTGAAAAVVPGGTVTSRDMAGRDMTSQDVPSSDVGLAGGGGLAVHTGTGTAGESAWPVASRLGPPVQARLTVAEQLDQLGELRRRGVITRREFTAKKTELLSRM